MLKLESNVIMATYQVVVTAKFKEAINVLVLSTVLLYAFLFVATEF